MLISNDICSKDGRCLYLKHKIYGEDVGLEYYVKSCYKGYCKVYSQSAFELNSLSKD